MAEPTRDERVELALNLLAYLEADELSLAEVVDRIETVTMDPTLTHDILDAAEPRGIIGCEGGHTRRNHGGTFVRSGSQVVQREGDLDCRRCGAFISTDHLVRFDSDELRPFGSSCMRKAPGRE